MAKFEVYKGAIISTTDDDIITGSFSIVNAETGESELEQFISELTTEIEFLNQAPLEQIKNEYPDTYNEIVEGIEDNKAQVQELLDFALSQQ